MTITQKYSLVPICNTWSRDDSLGYAEGRKHLPRVLDRRNPLYVGSGRAASSRPIENRADSNSTNSRPSYGTHVMYVCVCDVWSPVTVTATDRPCILYTVYSFARPYRRLPRARLNLTEILQFPFAETTHERSVRPVVRVNAGTTRRRETSAIRVRSRVSDVARAPIITFKVLGRFVVERICFSEFLGLMFRFLNSVEMSSNFGKDHFLVHFIFSINVIFHVKVSRELNFVSSRESFT